MKLKQIAGGFLLSLTQIIVLLVVAIGFMRITDVNFNLEINLDWWVLTIIIAAVFIHMVSHIYIFSAPEKRDLH
ncbi:MULTISPECIES: hypothetical protein [Paenibacillus]|uniref:Bacteriocin immunity protein n=1 Tax=Paenibacillus vandeheii TaxID=3035917 RepID=A0ABT8JFQ2_9BACL|nr:MULTISPECIES: hypothetical protein [Paenibacillus]KGP81367.1 hypothetical protein P363_0128150 [Paenibacillus sp. MAEPY1]KGP82003.1 hypothetical protein P364_0114405 [Paenibacillus sp. MAEPY2]MDN4603924.1 hypothetical protein [Paenibacillus vandeheii]